MSKFKFRVVKLALSVAAIAAAAVELGAPHKF
jgi:hypothetical protein